MKLRHSIMLGMLGPVSDRFHVYHPAQSLAQRLAMVKQVHGADGVEIVYPSEFSDPAATIRLVKESGLAVSAVNLNLKSQKRWENGSFTAPDPAIRTAAVGELRTALDLAAELGAPMVSCCPLIDGHNYSFEVDYLKQWHWLEEGLSEGARHRADVRLSLEYKANESRNFNILPDLGRSLYLCERLGLAHVGITVDFGHALIAKEAPAEVTVMAAQVGRLFYLHLNDNTRDWDWDMLPGAVNLWDLLEVMFYLHRLDWQGWVSYDVVARGGNLVQEMSASIAMVELARALVEKIGPARLQACIADKAPGETLVELMRALL